MNCKTSVNHDRSFVTLTKYLLKINFVADSMYIRVGKTGSLGPWSRVIVYCRSVRMLTVIPFGIKNNW